MSGFMAWWRSDKGSTKDLQNIIQEAVDADRRGEIDVAIDLYVSGIEKMMAFVKGIVRGKLILCY